MDTYRPVYMLHGGRHTAPWADTHRLAEDSHLKVVFIQNHTKVGVLPKIVTGQLTSLLSSHFVLAHSPLEDRH